MKKRSVSLLLFFYLGCAGGFPPSEKGGNIRDIMIIPNATVFRTENYKFLGRAEGESSTFFILGMIPVTNPLNIEYALSQAVQKYPGGQSIINVIAWHETHYYFPLGRVSVIKVEGDVIGQEPVPGETSDKTEADKKPEQSDKPKDPSKDEKQPEKTEPKKKKTFIIGEEGLNIGGKR